MLIKAVADAMAQDDLQSIRPSCQLLQENAEKHHLPFTPFFPPHFASVYLELQLLVPSVYKEENAPRHIVH